MRRASISLLMLFALGVGLTAASGCQTTKPWQRETLANPSMATDLDPGREILRRHVLSVREGSVGGMGGGGGGCGCN